MREKPHVLDRTGQNGAPEPQIARTYLYWLEALAGCDSQEELAHMAKVDSRTLRRFAAGQGGRKTAARLAGEIGVPLWVVHEAIFPAIAAVHAVWRIGREGGDQEYLEVRSQALEAASRISVVVFLGSVGQEAHDVMHLHPANIRALIRWLESLGDWSKEELARRAGSTRQTLWLYETGALVMGRHVLRNLADGVGFPLWVVEGVMLPAITAVRLVVEQVRCEEILAGWEKALTTAPSPVLADASHVSAQAILETSRRHARGIGPSSEDRKLADNLWGRLKDRSPAERVLLVKNCREYHSWSLAERLCDESREAAADSAKTALQLALLALGVARLVREEELFCLQLEGYVFLHIANARRVAGKMRLAEEAFARGLDLWGRGSGTKFNLLPAWRVLDLEGSLRRCQRRFSEALERLDSALEIAPRDDQGRIFLKKASTLNQMADPAAAIAVLQEAAAFLENQRTQRLWLVWNFLYVESLCHLGRFREAGDWLPKAQQLAAELGDKRLDRTRLEWVAGRIAAGLGELEVALAAFESLQGEFEKLGIAYDYALVSLDAGAILLEQGRLEGVKGLALKMEWIFKKEEIHPEAAKALDLFRRAAEGQQATPELARNVVRYLYRAQYNPELKFAA